ncbi:hypothetical protein [Limnovirga soli]|uniref:Uncharacterized protein n=1 Tax=Limnovirga soli TaxID=2656915 RepID=A0A8J8FGH5_9BACT|nr:hypothetical protein [Limnovirga soli]NNV57205.1 hypothetical protein [Limnovirga soli]
MPRKKIIKQGVHMKFIPSGRIDLLKLLAENNEHFKNKYICLYKYIEMFSATVERCWNTNTKTVAISQRVSRELLSCDNKEVNRIINDLVNAGLFKVDKSNYQASVFSYKYKPQYDSLDVVLINRSTLNNASDVMMSELDESKLFGELQEYFQIVKKISMCDGVYDYMSKELISNSNTLTKIGVLDSGIFVPKLINDANIASQVSGAFVPNISGISVPYQIIGKIPTKFIPVYKLLAGRFRISRPDKDSRIYTNITNLEKGYRKFLRLNSKPLIGIDISNSQPLIASILFRNFSEKKYSFIKKDVLKYQEACEEGRFYEHFMHLNNVSADKRGEFKAEFFGKVFFTKEIEKENYLKSQFKESYPTCYEAIFALKGNEFYSKHYKEFPVMMQQLETAIIFSINIKLIKMGYDVVNIFDSLYSDSEEAIAKGIEMLRDEFNALGIKPNFKIEDYRTESEMVSIDKPNPSDPIVTTEKQSGVNYELLITPGDSHVQPIEYFELYYGKEIAQELYEGQFE